MHISLIRRSIGLIYFIVLSFPVICHADQFAYEPFSVEGTRSNIIQVSPSETKFLSQLESDSNTSAFVVSDNLGVPSYAFSALNDDTIKSIDDNGYVYVVNGRICSIDAGTHTLSIISPTGARSNLFTSSTNEQVIALISLPHGALFIVGFGVAAPTKGGCYFSGQSLKVFEYNQETNSSTQIAESQGNFVGADLVRLSSGGILINPGSSVPNWLYKSPNSSTFSQITTLSEVTGTVLGEANGDLIVSSYDGISPVLFKVNLSNDEKTILTYPIESTDSVVAVRDDTMVFSSEKRASLQIEQSRPSYGIIRAGTITRNIECSAPFEYEPLNYNPNSMKSVKILSNGSILLRTSLIKAKSDRFGDLASIKLSPSTNSVTNYCGTVDVTFGKCEGKKPRLSQDFASYYFSGFQKPPKCNVKLKVLDSQGNPISGVQVTSNRKVSKKITTNKSGQATFELPSNILCRTSDFVRVVVGSRNDNFRKQYFDVISRHKCSNP